MSTNKTENYSLHAWGAGDDFLREEFNENFSVIDEGLGLKCEVVTGSYKGSKTNEVKFQTIDLGFTPRVVFVWSEKGICVDSGYNYTGIAMGIGGAPEAAQKYSRYIYTVDGGFQVTSDSIGTLNNSSYQYYFMAVR